MRSPSSLALAVAACLLVAGCTDAGPPDDGTAPAPTDATSGPGGPDLPSAPPAQGPPPWPANLTGCQQLHATFPVPSETVVLPPGFSPAPLDPAGATTAVFVYLQECASAEGPALAPDRYADAWVAYHVVPPPDLAAVGGGADQELLALTAVIDHDQLWGRLAESGLAVARPGSIVHGGRTDPQGGTNGLWTIAANQGTYQVPYATPGADGTWDPVRYRYWLDGPDGVWGYVAANASAGPDRGTGAAAFVASDDPEAPPVQTGLGHRVDGVDVTMHVVRLAAQPP